MKAKCSTARGNHGSRVNWRRRRLTATFCALTVPLLALTGCTHGKQQDARLRRVVVRRLAADQGLDGANIDVAAADGVVTLSGVTNTNAQRSAAGADANIVGAVTQVINKIESLEALQATLQQRLAADSALQGTLLRASVGHGSMALSGQVASTGQRMAADEIAPGASQGIAAVLSVRTSVMPQGGCSVARAGICSAFVRGVAPFRVCMSARARICRFKSVDAPRASSTNFGPPVRNSSGVPGGANAKFRRC